MMKVNYIFLALWVILIAAGNTQAADIEIASLKVTYKDDQTTPGKVIIRELKNFQDDTYWSKPEKVDIFVELKNNSKDKLVSIRVKPELYLLLTALEGSSYPPVSDKLLKNYGQAKELKSFMKDPVWVWNRVLGSRPPVKIGPGQKISVKFTGVDISNPYYPTDYTILAFSIRVFAKVSGGRDPNYSNNVADHIVMYGD